MNTNPLASVIGKHIGWVDNAPWEGRFYRFGVTAYRNVFCITDWVDIRPSQIRSLHR